MIKFFMKFLYFCGFLYFGIFFIFFCYLMSVSQNNTSGDWYVLFFYGGMTLLFFWILESEFKPTEKEPEETPTVTNIDKPKESDDVVVTEIQGERKIIKNGKVIYSEKLKADELKVFENLKDKN